MSLPTKYGTTDITPKEMSVIQLVARGFRNEDIGQKLGTTVNVVANHLHIIYDKLGFWNRVELALWYIKHHHKNGIAH